MIDNGLYLLNVTMPAKLAERGFLLGLGLRASRFSTWRASLRFWRLRLVIVLSHGFRFVQRFNGGLRPSARAMAFS